MSNYRMRLCISACVLSFLAACDSGGQSSGQNSSQNSNPPNSETLAAIPSELQSNLSSPIVQITKRNAPGFAVDGGQGAANGQNVYLSPENDANINQHWIEIDHGNNFFSYRKAGTDHCLDGRTGAVNNQNVHLWACGDNSQNQHWQKFETDSGFVQLRKRNALGFALDGGTGGAAEQNVQIFDSSNPSQNLQWRIEVVADTAQAAPAGECEVSPQNQTSGAELGQSLTSLQSHLNGSQTLTEDAITNVAASIENFAEQMSGSSALIDQAFDAIAGYDDTYGPLFLNDQTQGGVPRQPSGADAAIHYAMITLQQSVIDYAYVNQNVRRYRSAFENRGYSTADYFPGVVSGGNVAAVANDGSIEPYTVDIDASNNPATSHRPYGAFSNDSRRPTGAYAPAGAVVEVTVPEALVGTGYKVRVGAHSWDLARKNTITRLDRVSLVYDIECSTTLVSNPLGGGIYIEVPFQADAGAVNVQINNAVRSPFYAARSFTEQTSAREWATEKTHGAPWADLEGDHFMIQVPTPWLDEIDDPARLMEEWDASMQSILDLYGVTETQKTMLYLQVDTTFRGTANFPGYPMSNFPFNPAAPDAGNGARSLLRGPDEAGYVTFHELGHQLLHTKFQGEVESVVHLPYINFLNRVFKMDLDDAFRRSSFRNSNVNMDQAFMSWAVRPNFQQGLPMRSARPDSEKAYQRRGYTHYVTIAKLFGWQALEKFWASEHVDFANGIDYDRNSARIGDTDSRILRMSRAAEADLRPLLHMWGIHPESPVALAAFIQDERLAASVEIYDELQRYKTLVPMNNLEFMAHARTMYPLLRANANTAAFEGWYFEKAQSYSTADGQASQQALQSIIDLYFPAGRPTGDRSAKESVQQAVESTQPLGLIPAPLLRAGDAIDTDHHAVP